MGSCCWLTWGRKLNLEVYLSLQRWLVPVPRCLAGLQPSFEWQLTCGTAPAPSDPFCRMLPETFEPFGEAGTQAGHPLLARFQRACLACRGPPIALGAQALAASSCCTWGAQGAWEVAGTTPSGANLHSVAAHSPGSLCALKHSEGFHADKLFDNFQELP